MAVVLKEVPVGKNTIKVLQAMGCEWIRRWVGEVPDGYVRITVGMEPIFRDGKMGLHMSLSHSQSTDMVLGPDRWPTFEEKEAAIKLFPGKRWEIETDSKLIHFWEKRV